MDCCVDDGTMFGEGRADRIENGVRWSVGNDVGNKGWYIGWFYRVGWDIIGGISG